MIGFRAIDPGGETLPNGGTAHCGHCLHFSNAESRCTLRGVPIEASHWTTCRNFGSADKRIKGPLLAIVCEVRRGGAAYGAIPYFDGRRVDTVQPRGKGDTVVRFLDHEGREHEFASVADYLAFYERSGPAE